MATIPNTRGNPQASDIAVQTALPMVGSASREDLQSTLGFVDAELAKLYEDRNVQLTDGGLISYLGTSVQFTQSLKLHINSKVAGGAPVIINLGSTTRNISADGRMIYAVIDRSLGTATVTDDASTLAAVTSANQEVYLIAKRVDSPDGVKRLYFRNGSAFNEGQTARLGSAGSGDGSGTGTLLPEGGYKAAIEDKFLVNKSDTSSYISTMTTASYSVVNKIYNILCDKSKTITTVGAAYTISSAPSFTMQAGDIIWDNSQRVWRRVATVSTATTGILNQAFPVDLTAAAGMISQAVHTKDLVNYGDSAGLTAELPYSALLGTVDHQAILVDYRDSLAASDVYGDMTSVARVSMSASNEGLVTDLITYPNENTYGSLYTRPTYPNQILDYGLLSSNTNKQRLFLTFFANPDNGAVTSTCNLIRYKVSCYPEEVVSNGGVLRSAYCWTDSSGTPNQCTNPTLVADPVYAATVTQINLSWDYIPGLNSTRPDGDLMVMLEGLQIPRYYTGVTGLSYREIDSKTIRLSSDLSALTKSVHVQKRQGTIDISDANYAKIRALYQAAVGSAAQVASGAATHTSITSAIADISAGQSILVLAGTYTENVTVNKACVIEGQGNASVLSGNLIIAADYVMFQKMRVTGNVTLNAGSDYNNLATFWCANSTVITDNGSSNIILAIQD